MTTPRPSRADYFRQRRAARAIAAGRTPGKPGPTATQPCGTYAAARRHERNGEPVCTICRLAVAEYMRDRYHQRRRKHNTDTTGETQ